VNVGRGGVCGVGEILFCVPSVTSVTVLEGSATGGVTGENGLLGLGVAGVILSDGITDLGAGILPNSTTAGFAERGAEFFFIPITSSAIVGILKLGAFKIGRGTDSV